LVSSSSLGPKSASSYASLNLPKEYKQHALYVNKIGSQFCLVLQ